MLHDTSSSKENTHTQPFRTNTQLHKQTNKQTMMDNQEETPPSHGQMVHLEQAEPWLPQQEPADRGQPLEQHHQLQEQHPPMTVVQTYN